MRWPSAGGSGMHGAAWRSSIVDIRAAVVDARLWLGLGWSDIKRQYRRSFLGPVWLTASVAIFVIAFSVIGANVFNSNVADYVPYLAIGHVLFTFISSTLNESCQAYVQSEHMLRQVPMSKLIPPLRCFYKNVLVFMHNMLVPLAALLIFGAQPSLAWLSLIPVMLLIAVFVFMAGLFLAIANLRYRDTAMIVVNGLMILFFITPVFWPESQLSGRAELIVSLNPVAAMLRAVRMPILEGRMADDMTYVMILASVALATILALLSFVYARKRVVYWL
jgi:ABC-type polysaccharide/polyol phosphate export permease